MRVYIYWTKKIVLLLCIWLCNVLHNAVAHPLIPFLPHSISDRFHDWTFKLWQTARSAHFHHYLLDEGTDF